MKNVFYTFLVLIIIFFWGGVTFILHSTFYILHLQYFRQFIEFVAVRALDKNRHVLWLILRNGKLHFLNVLKKTECDWVLCRFKFLTHKPNLLKTSVLEEIHQFLMLFLAYVAKFAHGTQDAHLVWKRHLTEVVQGSMQSYTHRV